MPQYLSSCPILHSLAFHLSPNFIVSSFNLHSLFSSPISQNTRLTATGMGFSAFREQEIKWREMFQSHVSGTKHLWSYCYIGSVREDGVESGDNLMHVSS
jgi:hypothetical protein